MTRKKAKTISNGEIIQKLTDAGLTPESRYSKKLGDAHWNYAARRNEYYRSYKIPIQIYNKVIGKRFVAKFQINNIVRTRGSSSRTYNLRAGYSGQDVGDIFKFKHLGIGSGKSYVDKETKEKYFSEKWAYGSDRKNINVLTIGQHYITNMAAAHAECDLKRSLGYKTDAKYNWEQKLKYDMFYNEVKLEPSGLFGPKELINGYITDVFVHFIYPKWEYKREARYGLIFDTGATAIYTADMLDRVFDTDFDADEKIMVCPNVNKCQHLRCDHKGVHINNHECPDSCDVLKEGEGRCSALYDFSKLIETTTQRGMLDEEET